MPHIEPLIIFLVTGMVSMSAALSAGALNKLPDEDKPAFASGRNGMVTIIMAGNLAAITLLFSMAYGFSNLDWWIPLLCMFITFPVAHVVVIQQVLGDVKTLLLASPLVIGSMVALYLYW
ncbi:hypothetical protein [uncultured Neptuniibacter sp.]|uniref:hypothetical protein n=1 Tax=uncultured Neptuniibacter sp. TaxID=502143 RepID=UPI00262B84AD|nr:hypothetical protein [uncultured Neptuniibacter sp.]